MENTSLSEEVWFEVPGTTLLAVNVVAVVGPRRELLYRWPAPPPLPPLMTLYGARNGEEEGCANRLW